MTALATLICALCIGGLFYLNRDRSAQTSGALCVPTIWFWILGSRSVSAWLGQSHGTPTLEQQLDGSPTDRLVFQILLACGLAILARRGRASLSVMAINWPIVLYFSYCLMSVMWSDFPDVSFKRWIKATGDVVMALVVVTDAQPLDALRKLFSRLGFVLLPASILLIRYYPYLGRNFDRWSGLPTNTGVTTDKNILGVVTYVLTVGTLWQVLRLWREPSLPSRSRQLLAQCIVLGFGVWVLFTANSATSESCFLVSAFLMLVTGLPRIRSRTKAVHALVLTLVLMAGSAKVTGADAAVFHALGRKSDLTGRASDIWPLLIPMVPNVLFGAGFESFWLGPRLQKVWDAFPTLYVNEAHNGYIEVYLNLGAIGVGLIMLILIRGYTTAIAAFRNDPGLGSLTLAYVLAATMYSYTEAGFRMLDYAWSFLILSIIAASRTRRINAVVDSALPESEWWSASEGPTT